MEVIFYYNMSDSRVMNKTLITGETFEGIPVDEVDVMSPILRFEKEEILRYNYAYIPELQRYYSVSKRTAIRDSIWDVIFAVDVLMSFRGDINQLPAVVDKQSMEANGNEYIDDSSLVAENVMFQTVYNFPNGFNDKGEYILITAG